MKKLFSIFLALTLSAGLWAQETQTVSYLYPVYKTPDDPASGIKEWQTGTVDATVVTGSDEEVAWNAGWYVVTGADVMFQNGISCHGEVHLILADGAKLTADSYWGGQPSELNSSAIKVRNFLAVYGQADQSGQLCANGISEHAGIYCLKGSSIIINGGKVTATGENAAGIGGESATDFDIIINGGTVTATSMSSIEDFGNMEGIYISDIIINGGTITANGGKEAAGIGCGFPGTYNITINGGTITANGGEKAAGIGMSASGIAVTSNITINININGGTVTAYGGENAASIGDAYNVSGSNITINGGTITAIGGKNGNAIGNGKSEYGSAVAKVATTLIVKADNSNPPTTVIANDRTNATDIAADFRGRQYATIESKPPFAVSYGENITVSPTFTSGAEIVSGTQITFTAADRTATGYAFVGFYKESTFVNQITEGVSGRTYTATVTDAAISVYAKYEMIKQVVTYGDNITVSPEFASGEEMSWGTGITFTAADRAADNCEFLGFYKDSAFENPITGGVSGRTYTATVNDAAISVYAKYRQYLSSTYIDENGQEQTADNAIEITNSSSTLSAGWYIVTGDNVSTGSLTCNGEVHLILADGAKLTATGDNNSFTPGIMVSGTGNSLAIYGQTAQSGQLIATGGNYAAGIGGGKGQTGSNITIYGGEITASGGFSGAGIGGGNGASGSNIFVATSLLVKAGSSENPTTVITNTGADLASQLAGKRYVTVGSQKHAVTYGDYITVSPEFASGANVACGTEITFTAADRSANGYEFVGFYKESTFDTPITEGVSGQTCTATVTDAAISVYAKYLQHVSVAYIDADGQPQNATDAIVVTSATSQDVWNAGWYVVNGSNVTLSKGAVCNGEVHLILADGAQLTATGISDGLSQTFTSGILVSGTGNSLAIYGQTAQSGRLTANGGSSSAGIGGGGLEDKDASNITINGGVITANGSYGAAGIGGGNGGDGSNITVNKGKVTASGGEYASAIGGGRQGDGSNIFVATTLHVKADNNNPPATTIPTTDTDTDLAGSLAGKRYAAIEPIIVTYGDYITVSPEFASGANITYGTEVTFTAADRFADDYEFVGFYKESTFDTPITAGVSGRTCTVTVTEAAVSVYAKYRQLPHYIDADGQKKLVDAAEITSNTLSAGWYVVRGSDENHGPLTCNGAVHIILADGAKLTAQGGTDQAGITVSGEGNSLTIYGQIAQSGQLIANGGNYGAGIGGGKEQSGSNITINGGTVTAKGGEDGAGIGGGKDSSGSNITINGGVVTAQGGLLAAAIGGGKNSSGSNITISGGTVTATGRDYAAAIGGGSVGSGSNITISGGTVTATAGMESAGIGGGSRGSGSNITINGGTVTATGGASAAGIGGGYKDSGSNITINGGTVIANGGEKGAGIGGGENAPGSNITINGGVVSANGGDFASGIGGGKGCPGSDIFVAVELIIRADGNNPPLTVVAAGHTATTDIASELDGKRYATVRIPQGGIVTYGEYITVDPEIASGSMVVAETEVTFTAADRWAENYEFLGFYKESTFENKITNGVSGLTYTVTVLDDDISVYAKYEKFIPTPYIDANGQKQSVKTTEITSETSTLNAGWYAVLGNDVRTASLTCKGEVNLILADGAQLTATGGENQAGITVSGNGNSLTIYGQTAQSGKLIAKGGIHAAGIGGEYTHGSNITINGGEITATGGDCGAGIGGGDRGAGYNIIINRGVVTATGGNMASGIGGGFEQSGYDITINGGEVTANGGKDGAGIGGGVRKDGYNITINGGIITANGGENAAGIGRGNGGSASNIKVAASLTVCADNNNPPMVEILHTSNQDIASSVNKRYVIAKDDATGAKEAAIAAINAAIEGVTNADIIAIATNAINAINAATSVDVINAIKEQALAAIASAKAIYASGLGEMGEPCEDCPSVEVTKGTTTIRLYSPEKVEFKKME